MNIFYANTETPKPLEEWRKLSEEQRIRKINLIISHNINLINKLQVISANNDGQVVVRMLKSFSASERGTLLLDYETYIKNNIDQAITVWGESLGDKNSLRNLRGIKVKVI